LPFVLVAISAVAVFISQAISRENLATRDALQLLGLTFPATCKELKI